MVYTYLDLNQSYLMRIAIASGKGGTGKTMVSTNLAWHLAQCGRDVAYVDTDVEEPNGHLFLQPKQLLEERYTVPVPVLPGGVCSGCGDCQRTCAFGAIVALKDSVELRTEQCHSCGACVLACKERSLAHEPRSIGTITSGETAGLQVWSALLDVGEPRAAPLILGLLHAVDRQRHAGLEILDVPPGTSCAAVAATRDADKVVLVTEPTPFGLHDLKLAVEMCQALELPISVVINRADLGDDEEMKRYLERQGISLLGQIPFIREVAVAYARQQLAAQQVPAFREAMAGLARELAP